MDAHVEAHWWASWIATIPRTAQRQGVAAASDQMEVAVNQVLRQNLRQALILLG